MQQFAKKGESDQIEASLDAAHQADEQHGQLDDRAEALRRRGRDLSQELLRKPDQNLIDDAHWPLLLQQIIIFLWRSAQFALQPDVGLLVELYGLALVPQVLEHGDHGD